MYDIEDFLFMNNKIVVKNVCKTFNFLAGKTVQKNVALDNVSFEVEKGCCTVLAGENGSGKSLLMSIIAGLEKCNSGSVEVFGKVGIVFQEAETQILGDTVKDDVAFGLKNQKLKKEEINKKIEDALKKVGLFEKSSYNCRFLSGGEKRRLSIACMLALDFPILVLDEPYANLDFLSIKSLNKLIEQLKNEGKTIIILSHELEKCLALADKMIVLHKGKIVFDGTTKDSLLQDLEQWNLKNPICNYSKIEDLIW